MGRLAPRQTTGHCAKALPNAAGGRERGGYAEQRVADCSGLASWRTAAESCCDLTEGTEGALKGAEETRDKAM